MTVRSPGEVPGFTYERTGNDPAQHVRVVQSDFTAELTNLVQLLKRNNIFMGRNLEHRIRRSIDDQGSCLHMLFSKLVNDFRSTSRLVPDHFAACLLFDALNQFSRESMLEHTEGSVNIQTHDLPMACHCILTAGGLLHLSIVSQRLVRFRYTLHFLNIGQAQLGHIRHR
ncbi:hypothetical protein D3C81_1143060 [compost metagenome]